MRSEIVGRESELRTIETFLEAPLPSLLLLQGDAGIGKSTLWDAALELGTRRSAGALVSRPTDGESSLSFTVLGDLLDDRFDAFAPELPAPQRQALAQAFLRVQVGDGPPDLRAVALGALGMLRLLGRAGPLLMAIDDMQWTDPASARVLGYVLRRIDDAPIRFIAATRGQAPDGWLSRLAETMPAERAFHVHVGPIDADALNELFRMKLGHAFTRPMLSQLHATASGNPFFAIQLAKAVLASSIPVVPYAPLPVPQTLSGLLHGSIAALSHGAREMLTAAAIVPRPTLSLLRQLSPGRAFDAEVSDATEAGIVVLAGDHLRFVHPLFVSTMTALADPAALRALHRRLATITSDGEQLAWHVARGAEEPDEHVAVAVEDAARTAYARGAPEMAAALAEESLRLTPADRRDGTYRRALAVADYQLKAGDTGRARLVLGAVAESVAPGSDRARLLLRLSRIQRGEEGYLQAVATLEEALLDGQHDSEMRVALLCELSANLVQTARLPDAEPPAAQACELARTVLPAEALVRPTTLLAYIRFLMGHGFDERTRASTTEDVRPVTDVRSGMLPDTDTLWYWALMLKWSDQYDMARRIFADQDRRATETHDEGSLPPVLFHVGELGCWTGQVDVAEASARRMRAISLQFGQPSWAPLWLYIEAALAVHRGEHENARSVAREGIREAERTGNQMHLLRCVALLGNLEFAMEDLRAARGWLARAREHAVAASYGDPGVHRFDGDLIETLLGLGELDEAETHLERLEERGRTLRRAWALATAARCRGVLAAARGDGSAAVVALEDALQRHQQVEQPVELARTWLALGTVHRRFKRRSAATDAIGRALEIFTELGMPIWAARAHALMGRTAARTSGPGGLTPTERQIALLVAEGKTNREIAEQAFCSVKTVEAHLTRIYSKLEVRSRTELARSVLSR